MENQENKSEGLRGIAKIREVMKDLKHDVREGKMPKIVFKRIVSCMEEVGDSRVQGMIAYPLSYILLLAFLAVLAGANGWEDMHEFASTYKMKLNGIMKHYKSLGVPSADTFRRVFGLIKPEEFQIASVGFLCAELAKIKKALEIDDKKMRHLSVDGKEQRGTGRKYGTSEKVPNLQTLHFYDVTDGICIFSAPIEAKTNEIPVAQKLLSMMHLKNTVVTFDALNTQRNTVATIIEGKGHYVGGLKGNQQLFYKEVDEFFTDEELEQIRKKVKNYRTITEKAHNRIEKRSYYLSTDVKWFEDLQLWAGLRSFVCYEIETEDLVSGKKTKERRYYIASLTDVELCADAIRSHWGIENQLHWHLDVTFSEDDNTTMDKNAFNNLSIMKKMVLSLLKIIQPLHKIGLKGIRKKFGWDLVKHLSQLLNLLDENQLREAFQKSQLRKAALKTKKA